MRTEFNIYNHQQNDQNCNHKNFGSSFKMNFINKTVFFIRPEHCYYKNHKKTQCKNNFSGCQHLFILFRLQFIILRAIDEENCSHTYYLFSNKPFWK